MCYFIIRHKSVFCIIISGDARQNEQNGVTASHVIFVRLHNHFEGKLHEVNPKWDGERLFQVKFS